MKSIKKKALLLVMICLSILISGSVIAFAESENQEINLAIGEKLTLKSIVSLPNSDQKIKELKVTWDVADKTIAKVDSSGNLTGLKQGTTTVTAKVANNAFISTSFKVIVSKMVTGVSLDQSNLNLKMGQNDVSLTATVTPENAKNKNVTWKSSNSNIVSVDAKGRLTAKEKGTAVVFATTSDGGYTSACMVTVSPMVTGMNVISKNITMHIGDKKVMEAEIFPANAYDKLLLYSYSQKGIVSINKKGEITALKEGTTAVIMKTHDGDFSGVSIVTVVSDVNKAYIVNGKQEPEDNVLKFEPSVNIKVGEVFSGALVSDLTNIESLKGYKVKWTSSDKKVATVDMKGNIKGINKGFAVITAELTQENNKVKAQLLVNVSSTVTDVEISKTTLALKVGQSETLTANVLPSDAYLKTVKWDSSDSKVAKVHNGKITAISKGTARITATSVDGGIIKTCIVTVESMSKGILLPEPEITIYLGEKYVVSPKVIPDEALVKTLKNTLSDKTALSVVKSKDNYVVTGLKEGSSKVTFTSVDGEHTAILKVNVIKRNLDIEIFDAKGNKIADNKN